MSVLKGALQGIANWYANLSATTSLLVIIVAAIVVMWLIYLLLGPWDQPYAQKQRKHRDWHWPFQWETGYCLNQARAQKRNQLQDKG